MTPTVTGDIDPFDLPEWLGDGPVVWQPDSGIGGYHVLGRLTSERGGPMPCDLLAVDEAYPKPVAGDELRHQAHRAWRHGQVLLVEVDERVTLAVPGTAFTADGVLETLSRLAKAVGAQTGSFAALLRPGD